MKTNKLKTMLKVILLALMLCVPTMFAPQVQAAGSVKNITVTNLPAKTLTLKKGKSLKLKVKVTVSGKASQAVTYKSSKTSVATVDTKGTVKAKKNGTAKITITSKANKKKSVTITVTVGTPVTKVVLDQTKANMVKGKTLTLKTTLTPKKPSNKKIVWTTSNKKVATVSSSGKVKAVKAGTATITATAADGSGKKATCKITVVKTPVTKVALDQTKANMVKGKTMTLKATLSPKSPSVKTVKWTTSNKKVATVSSSGKVKAVAAGTANITATATDGSGKKATCKITVVKTPVTKVALDQTAVNMVKGKSLTLKATLSPKSPSVKTVTWTTSDKKVATVSSKGEVKAVAAGIATITATAADGSGKKATCKVTVVKTPITNIAFSETSKLIYVGDAGTALTPNLTPAKPTIATLTWTSSDPKVATVDENGVVTAVAKGTTTITAAATDGSGKKATCSVTVDTRVIATSVTVANPRVIVVNLSEAVAGLTQDKFTVQQKMASKGTYNATCKIDKIEAAADSTSYTIYLKKSAEISKGNMVQVSVTGLRGSDESKAENMYAGDTFDYKYSTYWSVKVNEQTTEGLGPGSYLYGYCKFEDPVNLPAGITAEVKGQRMYFKGTPTTPGRTEMTFKITDELGNTEENTVTWLVYDETHPMGYYEPGYYVLTSGGKVAIGKEIDVAGGYSSDYTYQIVSNPANLPLSVDSNNGNITGDVTTAGDYTVTVRMTDAKGAYADVPLTLSVKQAVSLVGTIVDANGNALTNSDVVDLYFTNTDLTSQYPQGELNVTNNNGICTYTVALVPGNYDVRAYCNYNDEDLDFYLYNQTISASGNGPTIKLPIYQITVDSNNPTTVKADAFGAWEDAEGNTVGYGDKVYLSEGTYTLTTRGSVNWLSTYTAKIENFKVEPGVTSKTATVVVTEEANVLGEIKLDTQKEVPVIGDETTKYYKFIPSAPGTYYFCTKDVRNYLWGYVRSADGSTLNSGTTGENEPYTDFCLSFTAEAGKTYYLGVENGYPTTVNVYVSSTNPNPQAE